MSISLNLETDRTSDLLWVHRMNYITCLGVYSERPVSKNKIREVIPMHLQSDIKGTSVS